MTGGPPACPECEAGIALESGSTGRYPRRYR